MKKRLLTYALLFAVFLLLNGGSCLKKDSPVEPEEQLQSIGNLIINPTGVFVNSYNNVTVRLTVPAGVALADSIVKVIKMDANDKEIGEIGELLDNGYLGNGDEILGDNIYSGILSVYETTAGKIKLVAKAKVKQTDKNVDGKSGTATLDIYTQLTAAEFNDVIKTQSDASTQLNQYLGGNVSNLNSAVNQLTQWIKGKSEVQSAETNGQTSIEIIYKNGLQGSIDISVEQDNGSVTRGGFVSSEERKSKKSIPLSKQTVGTKEPAPRILRHLNKSFGDPDPKIIGNRNVIIYAPYEAAFAPHNEGQKVKTLLESTDFEFKIDYYTNQNATVGVLSNLTDYGLVILATHGSAGKSFLTGEIVDTNSNNYKNSYKALLKANKLKISTNVVIAKNGEVKTRKDVYGVNASYISSLAGIFPNSVILNNSCESTKNADLSNAFIGKGAKTYYGYDKIVSSSFCVLNADTLVKRLAKDLKTTGESFMAGSDPISHNAAFQMKGANDVYYPDDLINGDFEFGKIQGWTKDGDGRVISRLGTVNPVEGKFMGIISTGLGYTTATGKIYQTFTIRPNQTTLTVKWNFLSEEFLEYIGSQYQDYFRISIKEVKGSSTDLLYRTVDGIAADHGATKENAGSLISVSPDVVFDRGGVYMTGWKTSTFNVSAYRGKRVTLTLSAGDVGDSIFDTAILLDDIKIQ